MIASSVFTLFLKYFKIVLNIRENIYVVEAKIWIVQAHESNC